jgi:hypothetical protein
MAREAANPNSRLMQWTPRGAHFPLQIQTRTLNGDREATFREWSP